MKPAITQELSFLSEMAQRAMDTPKDFEEFWKVYPRKVGKLAALKAWKTAIKQTDKDTILKAVEAQKKSRQWIKDGGQYVPHPSTWLNQGRWDDEVEVGPVRSAVKLSDTQIGLKREALKRVEDRMKWIRGQCPLPKGHRLLVEFETLRTAKQNLLNELGMYA